MQERDVLHFRFGRWKSFQQKWIGDEILVSHKLIGRLGEMTHTIWEKSFKPRKKDPYQKHWIV
jgi:hypothetical protein